MTRVRLALWVLPLVVLACVAVSAGQAGRDDEDVARLRHTMLTVEDSRPIGRGEAAVLLKALANPSPAVVRQAVRALGRLERAEFLPDILTVLDAADPFVRAEAANALAQAAAAKSGEAQAALVRRLAVERDGAVRGAICDALGRFPYSSPEARVTNEGLLAQVLVESPPSSPAREGAVLGLESLVRRARGTRYAFGPETIAALRRVALRAGDETGASDSDLTRRAAVLALNAAGAVDAGYERLAGDRDPQVRRLAIAAVMGNVPADLRARLVASGLTDMSAMVRYESLRVHARHLAGQSCQPEIEAVADRNTHVALLAIDQLATVCPADVAATAALEALLPLSPEAAGAGRSDWLRRAHAVVSLSRRAPDAARQRLGIFVSHTVWQARVYATRAATTLRDDRALRLLAADPHAGVRAAAIDGLRQVAGHEADAVYREALSRPDYPVVMAAARALESTPERESAAAALMRALAELTRERRDTSRDARMAVLDRLAEVGGPAHATSLAPYLSDPDPRIAARAAEMLTAWTGRPHAQATSRHVGLAAPPRRELDALPAGLRVTMARGGSFDIRFFTNETPVSVWRIARLARQRYYDGLTWHRIVPNFIIQGGSPGADEFVGDGPFMRDELTARSHARGTVGVSTRGRDTGDAQWFINLVDNPRLDHDYTIVGDVTAGMDVVDAIVEGDVMARVEWIPAQREGSVARR